MTISSLFNRFSSNFLPKFSSFSLTTNTQITKTCLNAEKIYTHLLKHPKNPEKTLNLINLKLDVKCVSNVLNRCCVNKPLLGLRFFIWVGLQSRYKHSQHMYSLAFNLLQIQQFPDRIIHLFEVYRVENCVISVKLVKIVLNLCKQGGLVDEALWVLRNMESFGCRPDLPVFNVVIRLLCEKGGMDVVMGLVDEMEVRGLCPDMITFMFLVKGFCDVGRLEEACGLFETMRGHGISPGLVVYSALLDGICRFGSSEKALELLGEMEKEGGECKPNVITYTSVVQRFCEKGKSVEALSVLERMNDCECLPNRVTVSVLIKGLCDEGLIDEGYKLIDKIVTGGSVSSSECYSSLVIALLRVKRLDEAEKVFRWMLDNAVRPDGLACSILLRDLCLLGKFLNAFYLYESVDNMGFVLTVDSDIFSILLVGLCQQNHKTEVAKLASLMVEKGIQIKDLYVDAVNEILKGSKDMKSLSKLCNSKERLSN